MCRSLTFLLLALGLTVPVWAGDKALEIVRRIDSNESFKTESFQATMTIQKGSRTLTKVFFGFGQREGRKSFMEFTNPEDRGVKYLKLDNEMWIFFPDADDVMKISGHMLRQGMMGSDLSYEDMLENESLEERYQAVLLQDETVDNRACNVVELTAKRPDLTYERQKIFVDQERFVPLRLELYARGGRLLKRMSQEEVTRIGDRWVPLRITIQDLRRKDSKTVVAFQEIKFDVALPKDVFTKQYLMR
ncbi:MAG: outer membrane lipoprotein-sorting protein [candidate division FCPU426 bacterium]